MLAGLCGGFLLQHAVQGWCREYPFPMAAERRLERCCRNRPQGLRAMRSVSISRAGFKRDSTASHTLQAARL